MKLSIHILFIFVILFIVFFLYFYSKQLFEPFKYDTSIEIVVARYQEDLIWLRDEPFNKYDVIIYNKGDNNDFEKTDNVKKVVNLSNVGRDSYVYFHHIINNYNNLANVTVFLPGSIDLERKYETAKRVVYNIENTNDTTISCQTLEDDNDLDQFQLDYYLSTNSNNLYHNDDGNMELAEIRPYGNWKKDNFHNEEQNNCISWCILSGISKKHIQRKPISYYNKFYNQVANHNNPEVGHYIERAWDAIFHPLDDSHKIKSCHG